jgi:hypothetical protein
MKPALAMLGILCVTFAAASELVLMAVYRWNFHSQDAEFVYLLASVANVLSSLAWWIGVVLIGFATMVRDRRAVQLPSLGTQIPSGSSQSPPSA